MDSLVALLSLLCYIALCKEIPGGGQGEYVRTYVRMSPTLLRLCTSHELLTPLYIYVLNDNFHSNVFVYIYIYGLLIMIFIIYLMGVFDALYFVLARNVIH